MALFYAYWVSASFYYVWWTAIFDKNFCFFYVGTAKIIRGEKGNENLNVAEIQRYFHRYDNYSMPGEKSFLYGKSGSYQV